MSIAHFSLLIHIWQNQNFAGMIRGIMNKKQFLLSLRTVYTRLGVTRNGVGVIAVRSIPKGTDPFKNCDLFGGVLRIKKEELDSFRAPKEAKNMVKDFCALQKGYYHVPDYGIDAIDKFHYLNHSKNPNMETWNGGETFITMRKIQKGEELTVDYDTYHETDHFKRRSV